MMLSDVYNVHPVGVCGRPAGWRVLADRARLGRPGSRLPLRASVGHIVAAARLQLVTLRAKLSGAVYCNRPCLSVCLFVGLLPR